MTELIDLEVGDHALVFAPEIGGGIASWTRSGVPVLRPLQPGALESRDPRGLGCFPLVPFSGRVAGRRFTWRGVTHELPALLNGHAIHGAGWQEPWRVADLDASSLSLVLDHIPGPLWPFAFRAEQYFVVSPEGLTVELEITNTDMQPAPAAFGLHPYFPRNPATSLQFEAAQVWLNPAHEEIPDHSEKVPAAWNHAAPRTPVEGIDNCFAGWTRPVRIAWPDRGLALSIAADPALAHLVVYIPPGRDFFAVEPVANLTDGLNRMQTGTEHGFTVLAPGATLRGSVSFLVESA
jgi:aldose 1-epimerase